jgi:hypothetical protein
MDYVYDPVTDVISQTRRMRNATRALPAGGANTRIYIYILSRLLYYHISSACTKKSEFNFWVFNILGTLYGNVTSNKVSAGILTVLNMSALQFELIDSVTYDQLDFVVLTK